MRSVGLDQRPIEVTLGSRLGFGRNTRLESTGGGIYLSTVEADGVIYAPMNLAKQDSVNVPNTTPEERRQFALDICGGNEQLALTPSPSLGQSQACQWGHNRPGLEGRGPYKCPVGTWVRVACPSGCYWSIKVLPQVASNVKLESSYART